MADILLAWNNRTDEGTLSGGSWTATLPLANLQNRQVQKVARSSNATTAATQFTIDLGQPRNIGVLALVVHNISVAGTVRVIGSDNPAFTSPLYDSGAVAVWPTGVIPAELLEWEEDNFWLGTLSQQARAGYQSPFILRTGANGQVLRYWRVEISDTTNSDGYVQIGRLFMAQAWTPGVNYAYGAALGYEDPTLVDTSLSGAEFFDVRSRSRKFRFGLQYLEATEAYAYALELQRTAGISGEVLLVPDSDDAPNAFRRNYVGRLSQVAPVTQPLPDGYEAAFEIKELL